MTQKTGIPKLARGVWMGYNGGRAMLKKSLLSVASLAVVASSHAMIIDNFDTGALDLQLNPPNTLLTGYRMGSMLGGDAHHQVDIINNPEDGSVRHRVNLTSGVLSVSNEDLVESVSSLAYGVDSTLGWDPLNVDFTAYDRFRVHFRSNDLPQTVQIFLVDAENGFSGTFSTVTANPGNNFFVDILFTDWGTYNFADVDSIGLNFLTQPSGDFSVTQFEVVPEPATLTALAVGAAALMRRRKRA
jgi:hypothetical protein